MLYVLDLRVPIYLRSGGPPMEPRQLRWGDGKWHEPGIELSCSWANGDQWAHNWFPLTSLTNTASEPKGE